MRTRNLLIKFFKNQAELARVLGNGEASDAVRVKAHRIWRGSRPNEDEINILYTATNGALDANYFYDLPKSKKGSAHA